MISEKDILPTEETAQTRHVEDDKLITSNPIEVEISLDSIDSNEEQHKVSINNSLGDGIRKYFRKYI